jgi:hypothetical protein
MKLFKQQEDKAMQRANALSETERNLVFELASFPAAVEKKNLDLLCQAVDQVEAAEENVAKLSLDQIAVMEQLLADAKRNLLGKQVETSTAQPSGRQASDVSQASAAAEQ